MGHSAPRGGDRLERGVAGVARRPAGDRKDRQHAVAHEFEHFAAEGVHGTGDAVEPGVEGRDDLGGRSCFRTSAVKPRRSANRSAASIVSPTPRRKRTGQHARGAAPAEIGLERRGQRGARSRARRAAPPRSAPPHADGRPRRGRTDAVRSIRASGRPGPSPTTSSCTGPPASPASQRRPSPAEPSAPNRGMRSGHESQASTTSLLSARHSQVRRAISGWGEAQRERPAGERRAILDEALAEGRQEKLGRRRLAAAASTSQARVAERGMDRSSAGRASIVISVSLRRRALRVARARVIQPNG